jgi:hypothetical protein
MESPDTCTHSCFYLAFNGKRINDYLELGEVEGITPESELQLIEGIVDSICYFSGSRLIKVSFNRYLH